MDNVQQDPLVRPGSPLGSWFDVRRRRLGSWAFALNRLTGLGLTVYLFAHLWVLRMLTQGEERWDDFVTLARSPFFLTLDVVLIFGLLFHMLNGIRVALVGMGIASNQQRRLLGALLGLGAILFLLSAILVFTK